MSHDQKNSLVKNTKIGYDMDFEDYNIMKIPPYITSSPLTYKHIRLNTDKQK